MSLVEGPDGHRRCEWGAQPEIYVRYHDEEWGRPTTDERTLFEKLCLEGFQAGLSWLTILKKRENFRESFDNFEPKIVAAYDQAKVEKLLQNSGIIRHRGKIDATINNAQVLTEMHRKGETLSELIWSFQDPNRVSSKAPKEMADVPATTEASTALSKSLKKKGFKFVGPTTVYAGLQAMGIVNDHIEGCWVRRACTNQWLDLDISPNSA